MPRGQGAAAGSRGRGQGQGAAPAKARKKCAGGGGWVWRVGVFCVYAQVCTSGCSTDTLHSRIKYTYNPVLGLHAFTSEGNI